ncbi:MAG: hypothetical protein WC957_03575 [Candidatus Neomarinimicrobiota bacterium]|jgi:hypothetical protein
MRKGWIGFDFDGTLSTFDGCLGWDYIGKPIHSVIEIAKEYIKQGYEVRLVTARARVPGQKLLLRKWCKEHLGQVVKITSHKDAGMLLLFDDRCVHVETNTGRILG